MLKGISVYLSSGASIHSTRKGFFTWSNLGVENEEEWDSLSEEEQEEIAQEIAFEWLEWGYEKGEK